MRWTSISADPNSPESHAYRTELLVKTRQPPVASRIDFLCRAVAGKTVIDLGIVNHEIGTQMDGNWLHAELAKSAKYILGGDILDSQLAILAASGYNVAHIDINKPRRIKNSK